MKRITLAMIAILSLGLGILPGCSGTPAGQGGITPAGDGAAYLVDPVYPTDDVVVADTVVTPDQFDVDPTGEKDSTIALQKALYSCEDAGGTVWLPAGKYRVTGKLFVPPFVTLRGDWQDPAYQ